MGKVENALASFAVLSISECLNKCHLASVV